MRPLCGVVGAAAMAGVALWPESGQAFRGFAAPDLRLTVEDRQPPEDGPSAPSAPARAVNTIKDLGAALYACWLPPPIDRARPGMRITVMVSFNRGGEIFGEPRFTYVTPEATAAQRAAYQKAVVETLNRCTPLRITPALGGALAGRPVTITFGETRDIQVPGRNT